jgi:hypothetical protein
MRKSLVSLCATALAALLVTGAAARADSIPWGYTSADTVIYNTNNPIKTSSINFNGSTAGATGDSGIIIYNLESHSSAEFGSPDSFSAVPFHLEVTLTDIGAGGKGTPSGTVKFDGTFSASNATKQSLLPDSYSFASTHGEVILGSDDSGWSKYSVDIFSFTPPGQPGGAPGSVQAVVHITPSEGPGGSGGPPPAAPEPTSLLLAAFGLPALGVMARRRLKKAAE